MPRKRVKSEKEEVKEALQELETEELATLEEELEPEELESLEEEFAGEEALEDLNEEELEEMATAQATAEVEAAAAEPLETGDGRRAAAARADEEVESFPEYEEGEEEEEIPELPARRETRQELLGRLMSQLLEDREQVHQALERVRDLNTQLRDAGPRPPEKLKEAYHRAITELSQARRQENFARAELMQVLSWRG
jgi:hypothetical protein